MERLKLGALDDQDLTVISAHVQDAVLRPVEIRYDAKAGSFIVPMRRYVHEKRSRLPFKPAERRLAVLQFDRVRRAQFRNIEPSDDKAVLNLLAIQSDLVDGGPDAAVTLVFSADASIRLDLECIEARLADLGAAWQTKNRPVHPT